MKNRMRIRISGSQKAADARNAQTAATGYRTLTTQTEASIRMKRAGPFMRAILCGRSKHDYVRLNAGPGTFLPFLLVIKTGRR